MNSNQWLDISIAISAETPVWPGDPSPIITALATHEAGDGYHLSEAFLGLHAGTHIDAPLHFIPGGKDITAIAVEKMLGPARVLDATGIDCITAEWLTLKNIRKGERLLFKTIPDDSSRTAYQRKEHFNALDISAAVLLSGYEIQLVGIDGLSIAINSQLKEVHVELLSKEIVIIENICLLKVEEGEYDLLCLPLKIQGAEAAPARVFLKKADQ